jgi:hypothetical protein
MSERHAREIGEDTAVERNRNLPNKRNEMGIVSRVQATWWNLNPLESGQFIDTGDAEQDTPKTSSRECRKVVRR